MDLPEVTDGIRNRLAGVSDIRSTIAFDFGKDGVVHIDARNTPATVTNDVGHADCRISIKFADFLALAEGTLSPGTAFITGKIKVKGSMATAMKIRHLLLPA
jgi:putative sterol carrier protein